MNGVCKKYYINGQLKILFSYILCKKHGEFISWFFNGNIKFCSDYVNNVKHGRFVKWDVYGNVTSDKIWDNGKLLPDNHP